MYFDNYLRTNEEAADFSGVVAEEVAPLSEYEMAGLGINIMQEGAMRNVFTTTADRDAAESRRNIFRTAIERVSIRNEDRLVSLASAADQFTIDGRAMYEAERDYRQEIEDTQTAYSDAMGQMNNEEKLRFVRGSTGERLQMLREFANQETQQLENRIELRNGFDAQGGTQGYTATTGALLAVARANGNNQDAMTFALGRTTELGARLTDMSFGSMFSGSSDRQSFISRTNETSRNAAPYLLAMQTAQQNGSTPEEVLTENLMARGLSRGQAREQAQNIAMSGRTAIVGMSPQDLESINEAIAGGVNLSDADLLERTLNASEEFASAGAMNQYAAAFDEASSQNLDVLRQQRAGDFMRSEYGSRFDFQGRSGAEVFSEMTPEEIEQMNSDLNDLRGEITRAEVAGADPEERRRLQQRAAQLEEYINLSGQGDSTNRLVRMAAGSLFVNGEFQGGNVATVVGQMGFSGASGALNQLAALTDERSTERTKRAAFANLVGDSPEQQAAFAERLGLDAGATMDQMRTAFNRRSNTPGDTLLQDLVQDLLKSTGVDVSDEADTALQRDAYTAMIGMAENLANSVTSSGGRRAVRVLSAADITSEDNANMSGGP
jgi:hypothetical protein